MLNIILTGEITERTIFAIDAYFDSAWEPEWIDNDFAREVIRDIDKSEVVAPRIIDSPYLGYVDPTWISGGTKCILCLMFCKNPKWIFDITVCGENCAKWIQRIGAKKDITVQLDYLMPFDDNEPFPIRIENTGKLCNSYEEFIFATAEVPNW